MTSRIILLVAILFNISLSAMVENKNNETLFFNKIEKTGPIRHAYFLRFRTSTGENIVQSIKVDNGAEKRDYYVKMPSESKIVVPWHPSEAEKLHVRIWHDENLISKDQDTNSILSYQWSKKAQDIYELHSAILKYANQYHPIIALFAGKNAVASQYKIPTNVNSTPEMVTVPGDLKDLQIQPIVVFEPTNEWSTSYAKHQMEKIKKRSLGLKKDKPLKLKEIGSQK